MTVGGVPQRDFVVADGFGDALECLMQLHRLCVPPMHDVLEPGRRRAAPYRLRDTTHAADERLQRSTNLLIAGIDGRGDRAHEIEIGAECIAARRCAHWFLFPPIPRPTRADNK